MLKKYGSAGIALIAFAILGFRLGVMAISDNSGLTHIRTGLDIFTSHHIPNHDPYSFTGLGLVWRSQSWIHELLFGALLHLNNSGHILLIVNGLITATFIFLMVKLPATTSITRTVANGLILVGLSFIVIAPRPLMFGLLCMLFLIMLLRSKASLWWAIPIGIVWQWSHGTWVVGAGILFLIALGSFLDKDLDRRCLRLLGTYVIGVVIGSFFPYGPVSLFFVLTPFERPEVFKHIIEWRSPDFQSGYYFLALIALIAAIYKLIKLRPRWRYLLPVLVVLAASLWSIRNFGFLAIVLAFTFAECDTENVNPAQSVLKSMNVLLYVLLGFVGISIVLATLSKPAFDFADYPVKAINRLERAGYLTSNIRMANRESVGNYLICRFGTNYKVFDDDRFDFYPEQHEKDMDNLLQGSASYSEILKRNKISVVLWARRTGLTQWLSDNPDWKLFYRDKHFVAFVKKGVQPGRSVAINEPTPCD